MKKIGDIFKRFSGIEWFYIGLVLSSHTVVVLVYRYFGPGNVSFVSTFVLVVLLIMILAITVVEIWLYERWKYSLALFVHVLLVAATIPFVAGVRPLGVCIFTPLIIGVCLYNEFPKSVYVAVAILAVVAFIEIVTLLSQNAESSLAVASAAEFFVVGLLLTILGGLMIRFRELCIGVSEENTRLDGLVDRLSRANLEYQEYAKSIEEASTEAERKRITRDIHDIVGYTLTNNITMMEAITDIMRVNPLGVSTLVNSARDNAEEGLGRVRAALHILREQQVIYPKGRRAVERMITIFSRATGVAVEYNFPDSIWIFEEDVEDTVYHLVQESMLNSFRHGKASRVRIFMSRLNGNITLIVRDNGTPGGEIKEDIGLAGMRERIDSLGGHLAVRPLKDGFEVKADIPVKRQ